MRFCAPKRTSHLVIILNISQIHFKPDFSFNKDPELLWLRLMLEYRGISRILLKYCPKGQHLLTVYLKKLICCGYCLYFLEVLSLCLLRNWPDGLANGQREAGSSSDTVCPCFSLFIFRSLWCAALLGRVTLCSSVLVFLKPELPVAWLNLNTRTLYAQHIYTLLPIWRSTNNDCP